MSEYGINPSDPLPRYYQVYVSLLDRIHAGEFGSGDALPSERQLVVDYGVSRITIMKAMDLLEREGLIEQQQGRGSFVVDRIEQRSDEVRPHIAFCMPTYADTYITSVLIGAACAAMREGVQLEIIGAESEDSEPVRIRGAIDSGAQGILLFPRSRYPDADLFQELRERRYPLVLLDRHYHNQDTDWVAFDDEQAGYSITKSLIDRGHSKIAIFPADEVRVSSVRGRMAGYQKALRESGLAYDEDLVCLEVYPELSPNMLHRIPLSHLRLFDRLRAGQFTAMIAMNQIVAMQMNSDLMRIKTELLQAVVDGGEASVMSHLDVELAAICTRAFEAHHAALVAMALQSGEVLGERAMKLLVRRMRQGCELPFEHIEIPMELVVSAQAALASGWHMAV
jgi:GntR family transcriptional regulator, arabinose operon transcriptional repressor